jgi:DNA-binding NarL/FixJ family response regulator
MHESEKLVSEVLAAGAHGYILKADTSRLLVAAVEALARHQPFFTGKVAEVVLSGYLNPGQTRPGAAGPVPHLTAREREIVQLLAEGKTNKEVAVALGVSVKTVDAHRANVMHKLDLHSVADLVRYAIRNQIIEA